MRKVILGTVAAAAMGVTGCMNTLDQQTMGGALIGGGLGALTGAILSDDPDWIIVGALGGAAAGALVARNRQTGMCAYARGDGTYYRARCP